MNKESKYLIIIEGLVIFIVFSILKIKLLEYRIDNLVKQNVELHDAINNRECVSK